MSEIGSVTIEKINESINYLVANYQKELNEAWQMCGDEALNISIGVKLEADNGETAITTKLSFTKEKVKDQIFVKVTEGQGNLFEDPPVLADQRGSNDNAVNM